MTPPLQLQVRLRRAADVAGRRMQACLGTIAFLD
jgi:hypothetical protein